LSETFGARRGGADRTTTTGGGGGGEDACVFVSDASATPDTIRTMAQAMIAA
jgi:hypothetical protein